MTHKIRTPDGVFDSIREAGRFYGVSESAMTKRLKVHSTNYFRIETGSHPEATIIDLRVYWKFRRLTPL